MRPQTVTLTGTGTRYVPVNFHMDPPFYGIQTFASATAGWAFRIESTVANPWAVATATTGHGFDGNTVWNGVTGFGSSGTTTATQNGGNYVTVNYPVSAFAITASSFVSGSTMLVTILPIGLTN